MEQLLEEASTVIVSPQIKQILKDVKIYLRDEVEPSGVYDNTVKDVLYYGDRQYLFVC